MDINRKQTQPLIVPRTLRNHEIMVGTTMPAGKLVPIAFVGLLREEAVRRTVVRLSFEQYETAELLMNGVNVEVMAHFVPHLALDRFHGSFDAFNRSWGGLPVAGSETVIPYFETHAMPAPGTAPIFQYAGLHEKQGVLVNSAFRESYNQVVNHLYRNKSLDLEMRELDDMTLAACLWHHDKFRHMVPNFDQSLIFGDVPLQFNSDSGALHAPVKGIGINTGATPVFSTATNFRETGASGTQSKSLYTNNTDNVARIANDPDNPGFPKIYADVSQVLADLATDGLRLSLANIEAARNTATFARLRKQFNGLDDGNIIDLLMSGHHIPDQYLKQPALIARSMTQFGQAKRYSTTAGEMTESVVNGATYIDLPISLPRQMTGGLIVITASVTPEQLFERQQEPFFALTSTAQLPEYVEDSLDPEKVQIVKNKRIDVDHDQAEDTFAYEPLNAEFNVRIPHIGGDFYRPQVDEEFDENRNRFWAVETENPTFSEDFLVATNMNTKPFVDQVGDTHEAVARGMLVIEGNTVFGPPLLEGNDDYDIIADKVDYTRLDQEA